MAGGSWSRGFLVSWLLIVGSGCGTQRVSVSVVPPLLPARTPAVFWAETFDQPHADRWRELEVKGHTRYETVTLEGRPCLRATSAAGASVLLAPLRFNPETYEWLRWSWRVDQLVEGEALERKEGSDVAARVYVYFETSGLPWQKRNLDYVWSATLPVGTILPSAYSAESKIIVVESGREHLGQWRTVERNLEDDYERCFGEPLPDVVAIGLMTDTDNTRQQALAYFDDLQISRRPLTATP